MSSDLTPLWYAHATHLPSPNTQNKFRVDSSNYIPNVLVFLGVVVVCVHVVCVCVLECVCANVHVCTHTLGMCYHCCHNRMLLSE